VHIKTPLAVAITLTLAMGAAAPLQAAGQQAVAATGAVAADAVDLDRIEVRAQLESQIRAVDLKRSSDAIEDAVSSDALGQYPDKNVAESLQRLPGRRHAGRFQPRRAAGRYPVRLHRTPARGQVADPGHARRRHRWRSAGGIGLGL